MYLKINRKFEKDSENLPEYISRQIVLLSEDILDSQNFDELLLMRDIKKMSWRLWFFRIRIWNYRIWKYIMIDIVFIYSAYYIAEIYINISLRIKYFTSTSNLF